MSSRASLTSWGEGASLALVGHPSSDGATIKMPDDVDVLHWPASHPIFSYCVGLAAASWKFGHCSFSCNYLNVWCSN